MKTTVFIKYILISLLIWSVVLFHSEKTCAVSHFFNVNNGLSINEVTQVYQDKHQHYIWICTQAGLNRSDGHSIKTFYIPQVETSISNYINDIAEDNNNNLWLATNVGIACFNYSTSQWFELPNSIKKGIISSIEFLNDTSIFYVVDKKHLLQLSIQNGQALVDTIKNAPVSINEMCSFNNDLYLAGNTGLTKYKPASKSFVSISGNFSSHLLKIKYLPQDSALWLTEQLRTPVRIPILNDSLLLGESIRFDIRSIPKYSTVNGLYDVAIYKDTYVFSCSAGLVLYDKNTGSYRRNLLGWYTKDFSFNSLLTDNYGNLWAGTWQSGLFYVSSANDLFNSVSPSKRIFIDLRSRLIRGFEELANQTFAIATEDEGLVVYNEAEQSFHAYTVDNTNSSSKYTVLKNNIHSIKTDWAGRIWLGYFHKGFNIAAGPDKNKINREIRNCFSGKMPGICNDFYFDYEMKKAYIGMQDKIVVWDEQSNTFSNLEYDGDRLRVLTKDKNGNLWIGSRIGLQVYNSDNKQIRNFTPENGMQNGLVSTDITCIYRDSKDHIILGTYGAGAIEYNEEKDSFDPIIPPPHINYKVVFSMVEDNTGILWFATNNGLIRYDRKDNGFSRFGVEDGIQDNQFNYNAAFKDSKGFLYFGGINGFTFFNPDIVKRVNSLPAPLFSEIKINDRSISISDNSNDSRAIKVAYMENNLFFTFYSPNYTAPHQHIYAYRLLGYSDQWLFCKNSLPEASFINVPPGTYRFQVKVSVPNSEWSGITESPEIVIRPPFYKSWWAYLLYFIAVISMFVYSLFATKKRETIKNEARIALLEKENTEQIHRAKLRFFTDVAHEIRSPLTLIVDPVDDLLAKRKNDSLLRKALEPVYLNAKKLATLMDELLLFSKTESGKLNLRLKNTSITSLIEMVCYRYQHKADSKHIELVFYSEPALFHVVDSDKIEIVISNLINNALKFTPTNGRISIVISKSEDELLKIRVEDNGKGICAEEAKHIFERFFQTSDNTESTGVGIGLMLSKRIVDAHFGELRVESQPGVGSVFVLTIPKLEANVSETIPNIEQESSKEEIHVEPISSLETPSGSIMIVEDNEEIRAYLNDIFVSNYKVSLQSNGLDAYNQAKTEMPDLILSDFQMPVMDGVQMCRKIKTDMLTCHIPVIILSAYHEIEDQLKGFEVGADDYIGKPFNNKILLQKVHNILESRRKLIQTFQTNKEFQITKLANPDQKFLGDMNKLILKELHNEQLDVAFICEGLKISKTTLNLKLRSLLDISTADYIKKVRMREAYRLITENGLNATEAALAIGFSTSYFNTCFKKEFGVPPGKIVGNGQ